jgi:uncharacterized membrane protein
MLATTDVFWIVFRLLHIVAGVLWVGAAFLFGVFIGPAAAEVAPTAGPLFGVLVHKRKLPKVIEGLGAVTVLAGWIMWLRHMDQYGGIGDWVGSTFGLVLTIGAVLATIAFFVGWFGVGNNVERLVALGEQIAGGGGPPTPEQGAEMGRIQKALETSGKIDIVLLLVAVACMATARYW